MKNILVVLSVLLLSLFIGCGGGGGGGGGGNAKVAYPVDVALLDGYIINADVKDQNGTPVKYFADKKVYHFYDKPQGYIEASGGKFESGLKNKMLYKVSADIKVITPVVHFLNKYPDLEEVISKALEVSPSFLRRNYIEDKQIQIARFAQIVYAMNIHGLEGQFAQNFNDDKNKTSVNYDTIVNNATKASNGSDKKTSIQNFIYALEDVQDVASMENDLRSRKEIMQKDVEAAGSSEEGEGSQEVASVMSVDRVNLIGNLKLNVVFSEKVVVNTQETKNAFSLRKVIHSGIALDDNATINVNGTSLTLPLRNAIATEESSNIYTVEINGTFVSSEGSSLNQHKVTISPSAANLALENITFVNSRKIRATFNLPVDTSTVNQGEFGIKGETVTFRPTSIVADSDDEKTLIVTLGNSLIINLGYDLIIESENLAATNTTSKLSNGKASKEFLAKVVEENNLNNGFNLLSATVNSEQTNVTLNFSQTIMSNPAKSMFSISLDASQEPMDLNITDNNGTSKTINITPSEVLLSPDDNGTSYKLSVAKQSFYSVDGSRTLGSTYEKRFEIENYPKITATLSGKVIGIGFNMPMDLNKSYITITENGEDVNTTFAGSGANYTLTKSEDFNQSATILTINSGVLSTDGNYKLSSTFTKEFNSTQ